MFLYVANDYLAVRGNGADFYLCRVLEDVPESEETFKIAWFDRVDTEKQHYKVGFSTFLYLFSFFVNASSSEWQDLNH